MGYTKRLLNTSFGLQPFWELGVVVWCESTSFRRNFRNSNSTRKTAIVMSYTQIYLSISDSDIKLFGSSSSNFNSLNTDGRPLGHSVPKEISRNNFFVFLLEFVECDDEHK